MAASVVLRSGGAPEGRPRLRRLLGRLKIAAVLVVGGAALVAYETGYAGWAYARGVAEVFPADEDLLGWIPIDENATVILDPYRFHFASLGPPDGALRAGIGSFASDFKKATGIDLTFQVDKLAIARTVAAARGRFDGKKLADRLSDLHYMPADAGGFTYFAKRGEDAFAVIGDSVLLYGTEEGVRLALDAHGSGANLARDEGVVARLKHAGWKHPLLVSLRVQDDKPSVRAIVSGAAGPRSATIAASGTPSGLDLDAVIELASPSAAAETTKDLGGRKTREEISALTGDDLAAALEPLAKVATITTEGSETRIRVHADPTQVDAMTRAAAKPGRVLDWLTGSKIVGLFKP